MRLAVATALVAAGGACAPDPAGDAAPSPATPRFAITAEMRATAAAASDVEAMLDALARIEGWHRRGSTTTVGALRAGATDAQLDALEAALGCALPEEARALWRWRDGQQGAGDLDPLVWYHGLLPIEHALAEYRTLRTADWADWDATWVPVLAFEGEWYFVECGTTRVAASPLLHWFVEDDPKPAYASLTTFFATQAEAMDAGAIALVDGAPEADERALAAIHARHNPGVPFPYHVPP